MRANSKKIAELSGDMSMNLYMMRAIRKAIAEEEKGEGVNTKNES
jgi:hypothetical protein